MANGIDSKTKRARLAPRREPYWARIRAGLHLGYRKPDSGEGTWIVRHRGETGGRAYHSLGTILETAHGNAYDAARKTAEEWAGQIEAGARPKGETVADACRLYVENRRAEKGEHTARDAEGRFKRLVYGEPISGTRLAKLTAAAVEKWRNDLLAEASADAEAGRSARVSANRNLATLKAALNYALARRLVGSDLAWRDVKPFVKVGRRRERFLNLPERRRLLDACTPPMQALCTALLLTAARPGELAAATVADFDKRARTLALNGKTGRRTVTLSTAAAEHFAALAKGRIARAPLLARADGSAWHRFAWRDELKDAAKAAGLPADVVLYNLRHAAISEMLLAGINPAEVARLAGTSTAMIDRHYGHLIHERLRERLDAVRAL